MPDADEETAIPIKLMVDSIEAIAYEVFAVRIGERDRRDAEKVNWDDRRNISRWESTLHSPPSPSS